jgi:hypothetical protein
MIELAALNNPYSNPKLAELFPLGSFTLVPLLDPQDNPINIYTLADKLDYSNARESPPNPP